MGRLFVVIGGFLVLLLTAALVIPPFINWAGYRADFEREASRILGREVHVAGGASARLLPFPSVTFSDVRVGANADQPAMTVKTFSMGAELMPFLRGQILIFDMKIEQPHIAIALDHEGRVDWAIRPSTPLNPAQIKVEKLTISDGQITLRDDTSGREHRATDINAVLSATSLAGPWQMSGAVVFDGEAAAFEVSTGEAKPEGSLRVRARISPKNIPAMFETDGDMVLDQGHLRYSGQFGLRSADMVQNARNKTDVVEKPFLADLRVSGAFSADREQFAVDEFRMEQGPADNPYVVNGKALFDYGSNAHFEINADGQQVFWGPAASVEEDLSKVPLVPLTERMAVFRLMMEQLPIPSIPGSVDLRLPAIIAGGTTIRTVIIKAEPDGGSWNIRQLEADFPGRTKVEASGRLSIGKEFGGKAFGFEGDLLVASRQPSGLAVWLNGAVGEPVRRLTSAGFSGRVTLRDERQQIDNLEVALGATTLKGEFERLSPASVQPSIRLALEGGAVESDALQAFFALFSADGGLSEIHDQVNLSFKAGPVRYDGMEAGTVDTALRFNDGRFDVDRLMVADLAGATLTAAGTFAPLTSEPSGSLDATVLSDDLDGVFELLAQRFPGQTLFAALSQRAKNYPGLFADSKINIVGNAALTKQPATASTSAPTDKADRKPNDNPLNPGLSEISFSVSGNSGDMKLELSGTTADNAGSGEPLQLQMTGTAMSAQGEAVMALLGLPSLPLGMAGELEAGLSLQGAPSVGMRTQLKLAAPDGSANVDGVITVHGDDVTASGKAVLKAADIQPFATTAGYTLPGWGLALDMSSDFQFAKGILRFPNLAGKLNDEDVTAKIEASWSDSDMPHLRGEAAFASVDLAGLADVMLGPDAFAAKNGKAGSAKNKNIWPNTAFAAAPSLALLADLKLTAATADLGNFGTVSNLSAKLVKGIDELTLSEVAGDWSGGRLTGSVALRNNNKNAMMSADLDWNGANLRSVYTLADGSAPLGGVLKFSTKLSGNGGNIAELMHSLAGAATVSVDGLLVSGVNPAAMSGMLAEADRVGDTPDQSNSEKAKNLRFEEIASAANGQGRFAPNDAQFDLAIAGGVARMPAHRMETDQAVLESDFQLDLATLRVAAHSVFTLKTTGGKFTGSEPALRFAINGLYDDPVVTTDRQPLVQFLTQRALEREQERVEAMQAALTEKQMLRREVELYRARAEEREQAIIAEEARRRADAQARLAAQKQAEAEQKQRDAEAALARAAKDAAKKQAPPVDTSPINTPPIVTLPKDGQTIEDFLKTLD